jgi:hypothetical protein
MTTVIVWLEALTKALLKIGARLKVSQSKSTRWGPDTIRFNVGTDKQGEHFTLMVGESVKDVDVRILDVDPDLAQTLILVVTKPLEGKPVKEKLLLGHDERHWFVAGVPERSRNIRDAFQQLKPEAAKLSQERAGVSGGKTLDRRKNKGFIRQGEWFFVPVQFEPDAKTYIHTKEPIQRQGGTPHIVEKCVRFGGKAVFLLGTKIFTPAQKEAYEKTNSRVAFQSRQMGARVFVTGKVTHKDHKTVVLQGWHEVHMSREPGRVQGQRSAQGFLD